MIELADLQAGMLERERAVEQANSAAEDLTAELTAIERAGAERMGADGPAFAQVVRGYGREHLAQGRSDAELHALIGGFVDGLIAGGAAGVRAALRGDAEPVPRSGGLVSEGEVREAFGRVVAASQASSSNAELIRAHGELTEEAWQTAGTLAGPVASRGRVPSAAEASTLLDGLLLGVLLGREVERMAAGR